MAPNPIACSHRISVPVVVAGLTHMQRWFVKAVAAGASWDLEHQLSANQSWKDDAEHLLALVMANFHTSVAVGQLVLEEYAFGAYFPLEFYTPTADAGTNSGATQVASQVTWTFRDTLLRKAKLVWLESYMPQPSHVTSPGVFGAPQAPFIDDILSPSGDNDAGFWLRSRSEVFLSTYVAMTSCENDKVRRARGLL